MKVTYKSKTVNGAEKADLCKTSDQRAAFQFNRTYNWVLLQVCESHLRLSGTVCFLNYFFLIKDGRYAENTERKFISLLTFTSTIEWFVYEP